MNQYMKRRLFTFIPVLLGVVKAVFLIIHLAPGDPAVLMLEENAQPADIESSREQLSLNEPHYQQYWEFWQNLLRESGCLFINTSL